MPDYNIESNELSKDIKIKNYLKKVFKKILKVLINCFIDKDLNQLNNTQLHKLKTINPDKFKDISKPSNKASSIVNTLSTQPSYLTKITELVTNSLIESDDFYSESFDCLDLDLDWDDNHDKRKKGKEKAREIDNESIEQDEEFENSSKIDLEIEKIEELEFQEAQEESRRRDQLIRE